jgi:hemoglobin-like flavoprotein
MVKKFHVHLFNSDPDAQSLFVGQNVDRITGILKFFDVAVGLLDDWNLLTEVLREMGVRHQNYGVMQSHYIGFGEALLLTLGDALGSKFTVDIQDAWHQFYRQMADLMVRCEVR